jgi:trimeric autotransporter adhesin
VRNTFMLAAALVTLLWAVGGSDAGSVNAPINNLGSVTADGLDAITIPRVLSYQGKLTDTLGVPVMDTTHSVEFRLYTAPSGGSAFWNETQTVRTKAGLLSVLLGSVIPIGSMPDAGAVYLGMAVAGGGELSPRLRIASAAYAYLSERAASADLLQGRDTSAFAGAGHNHDAVYVNEGQADAVTSGMIVNGTIAAVDLGQMGATTNQVLKWTGSAWAPRNDSVGGGSVPDSVPGSFAVTTDLRVYGKGRIGLGNTNAGTAAFVAGSGNTASANYSSVAGGTDNTAAGASSHVGGGGENQAGGDYSFVGGGEMNYATGVKSAIGGGVDNTAAGLHSMVGGGNGNIAGDATGDTAATVAGGYGNLATAMFATVGGGNDNSATGDYATLGGGEHNRAESSYATVGGGYSNAAIGRYATIGGGYVNTADTSYATIGGGYDNHATGYAAMVSGGYGNYATGSRATVGGGSSNWATGSCATVGGGFLNRADTTFATVGGGWSNYVTGYAATLGGGNDNSATGDYAMLGGGEHNRADTSYATVGGGYYNDASGFAATVPGGNRCAASGSTSFAAGRYAKARGDGSFVWSDSCDAADSVSTATDNRWVARARGGVYFYTNLGMTTGSYLAAGSNAWASACDSATKEDFRPVDRKALLDKVASLRVRNYKMKDQDDGTRHIGPVAQDFHAAFGVGETETGINMADADGVLLAAVQALYEDNRQLWQELEALRAELGRR